MSTALAIGVDIGGTSIKAAIVDRTATIVARHKLSFDASHSPQEVIDRLATQVSDIIQSNAIDPGRIIGVGVGVPGPLDARGGKVIQCANLPLWKDLALRDMMAGRFERPAVIENDGNAAAYGEYWVGLPDRTDDLVVLTLGTGIGAGFVVNGALLRGHFQNAAELGHMIVEAEGLPCPCGQRGCLEQYASAGAVARLAAKELEDREPGRWVELTDDGQTFDAARVVQLAKQGDEACCGVWNNACKYLAIAAVNIQHLYNPARVVLGGGMSDAGEFLLDNVRQSLLRQRWRLCPDTPEITLASLGQDAGVVGAAGLALDAFGKASG